MVCAARIYCSLPPFTLDEAVAGMIGERLGEAVDATI